MTLERLYTMLGTPWRITCTYDQTVTRLVPLQESRDPNKFKKKWNGRRRSRGPSPHNNFTWQVRLRMPRTDRHPRGDIVSAPALQSAPARLLAAFYTVGVPFRFHSVEFLFFLGHSLARRLRPLWGSLSSLARPLSPWRVHFTRIRCQPPACAGPRFSLIIAIVAPWRVGAAADCADHPPVRSRAQVYVERCREPPLLPPLRVTPTAALPRRCFVPMFIHCSE